jgi:hypothetical protein
MPLISPTPTRRIALRDAAIAQHDRLGTGREHDMAAANPDI